MAGDQVTPAAAAGERHYMSVRGATFLGVGAMVGAGIFSLLGEAGAIAGAATWLSFLIAGCITMLLGYTTVKLGIRYPSAGGFVTYLREAFGNGHVLGITAWLGFFALLITAAMVAVTFGEYAASFFFPNSDIDQLWSKVFAAALIVLMTWVNVKGTSAVERAQTMIVITVLSVFAIFIVSTFTSMDADLLAPSSYPSFANVVSSVALTFFAFLGFAVITFSAGDMRHPERELPRAMYQAIGIATVVYVLVSLGVFGTLSVPDVIAAGSTAIAEAAEPVLGNLGFALIAVAAMLATSSATNSNLFGASHLTEMLGTIKQFPETFARETRRGRPGGLMITASGALLLAIGFDITAIASIGTATALALFAMLCVAGIKLRHETGAHLLPMVLAIFAILVVLVLFILDTLESDPWIVAVMAAFAVGAVALDFGYKSYQRRHELGGSDQAGGAPTGGAAPAA